MANQPVDLNIQELKELIKLLKESNVSEFELRKADYRLRIKHGTLVENHIVPVVPRSEVATAVVSAERGAPVLAETAVAIPATTAPQEKFHEVQSPMVGTFYRAPSPGATPFVEIGARVRKNQVLCIIEAMKIMNEIESDVEGEVMDIHVANAQPVEFGEILFSIKPTL
jgi:acetyl-CoA carboxylase biotin carboxyl carrier protein